jgi:acyl carrier protein
MTHALADVECALVALVRRHFGLGEEVLVDPERSFFSSDAVSVGDRSLDSIDLVELLVTVEEETDVPVIDMVDREGIDSLRGVAAALVREADAATIEGFCTQWRSEPVT